MNPNASPDRKQAKSPKAPTLEALRKIESHFRALMEISLDAIVLSDQNGIILKLNQRLAQLHGYENKQDLIGKCVFDLLAPEEYPNIEINIRKVSDAELGKINKLDCILQRKDGTRFWGELHTKLLVLPNIKLPLVLTVVRDITDRMRSEEALRESEEKYRTLVEKAKEIIIIAQDEALVFANHRTADLIGIPAEDLIGKPFIDFIYPEDRDMIIANYRKRIAGEPIKDAYDFRVIGADGSVAWVSLSASPILWKGRPATINLLTDITERKAAEDSALESLREKEALLKEVHHRVKNNMQVISSLFSLQIKHTRNDECRKVLKESQNRIRAMSLVHEKLYRASNLSRIDLDSYIQNLAVHLFSSILIDPAQVRLETNLEGIPLDINSAVPCGLILNELISNALQHGFPDGRKGMICIDLKNGPDGTIILRIADDGIGFPKEIDFRQPEGFGLQIVNLLVDQLDATIDLDRTDGTAFAVTFRELKYTQRI